MHEWPIFCNYSIREEKINLVGDLSIFIFLFNFVKHYMCVCVQGKNIKYVRWGGN